MKHLTINDVAKEDYRFIIDKPDANFSPERNYAVINRVIEDGMKMHQMLKVAQRKETEEKIDILSSYAMHAEEKTLDKYMGKDWMKRIYGEQLIERLQVADSIRKLNRAKGNTKFENYFLT